MHLHIGTSGFAYREWRGTFYPEKIYPGEMLRFYSGRFCTVEINASFYRLPAASVLASWAQQVPEHFRFAFKAPARITHRKRLKGATAETPIFLDRISQVGPHLGPVLFQLPPNMPLDLPLLEDCLASLPDGCAAFEFRHQSWLNDRVYDLLGTRNLALCISDRDDAPPPPLVATARFGYLRLRRSAYGEKDLEKWKAATERQGWEEAYVFFRHEETGSGPRFARTMREVWENGG